MAITSLGSFAAANNKIAGTTLIFTSSQAIEAGQLGVLFVATDNLNTTLASNVVTSVRDNSINYNFRQGTGFDNTARAIISQSDGKILVGGDFNTYNGQTLKHIVRLNIDGTLDTSFNNYSVISGSVYKLAIQPDVTGSYYSGSGVWSTATGTITARYSPGGAGTQNEGIIFGGQTAVASSNLTEEYNGTSWVAGGVMISARQALGGAGTQNAAVGFGGTPLQRCTEEYNGTSWAAGGIMINVAYLAGSANNGTQNAALSIGGSPSGTIAITCTEEYNGTTWTAGGILATGRYALAGAGTQNEGLAFGGIATAGPSGLSCTEEYNGTAWSAGGNLINVVFYVAGTGFQNTALAFGGSNAPGGIDYACTEEYDGTSWTSTNPLITARIGSAGIGTQLAALAVNGNNPAITNCVEEYTVTTTGICISDKIIAAGTMTGGAIRLNPDGSEDPSFNIGTGFNAIACTVIVQPIDAYVGGGTWTVGGALIIGREGLAGAGTQNEALAFGGLTPTTVACTEEYDGTSWTAVNPLITARNGLAGVGTQNEALAFGGTTPGITYSCTEEYDGTSWTAGGTNMIARCLLAGAGTQNAALAFGGSPVGTVGSCTEEYDGTSWTAGGALITARSSLGGAGTQNAGLAFGGLDSALIRLVDTEEYNGTTWTTGENLITARIVSGTGTQNAGLAFGGQSSPGIVLSCTEEYDGTSWTIVTPLITARCLLAGAGTQNAALAFGGNSPLFGAVSFTEEYTIDTNTTYTNKLIFGGAFTSYNGTTYSGSARIDGGGAIDSSFNIGSGFSPVDVRCYQFSNVGVWSVGGTLITARNQLAGAGTQNEALAFGGFTPPSTVLLCTEEYNGTSWAAGCALNTVMFSLAGAGTQNAGLAFGGRGGAPTFTVISCTEEYDGTSWTAVNPLNTARCSLAGAGTQNAGLAFGGTTGISLSCTEEYDGTSWTAVNPLNTARGTLAGAGTQNEGLAFGGISNIATVSCTEEYNGTSWTAVNPLNTARYTLAGAGTQNEGLAFGGFSNIAILSCTEEYNGTSWTSGGALINAIISFAGTGTQNAGLAFGGETLTTVACTEEYSKDNLLVVGNFTSVSGSTRNRIALLNAANGNLIASSSFNIGTGFDAVVNSIAIQRDNKIVTAGNFTTYSGSATNRIERINIDGTADSTFILGTGLNAEANTVRLYPPISSNVWSVGGSLIDARDSLAAAGTQNAGLAAGGDNDTTASLACTEEYNGTTWASSNILGCGRTSLAGAGTQNAGLVFGGNTPTGGKRNNTEEYDGTTWTAANIMIQSRASLGSAGTQNAALAFGGETPTVVACTEEYDGTTWTTSGNVLGCARTSLVGAGTQNAGLAFGGVIAVSPFANLACTEEYDGSSWTAGGVMIIARSSLGGAGTQNEALAFGGFNPARVSCTEEYNGTSWSTGGALICNRSSVKGAGTQNKALAFGGNTPLSVTCTEEYSVNLLDRLLVGGNFSAYSGSTYSGSVRILESGSRDTTFVIGTGFGATSSVEAFFLPPEGHIIAVGSFTTYSASFSPGANRIVKITSNGSIDASAANNTWSKLSERSDGSAAGAGATIALFYITASYDVREGTTITVTTSANTTAKSATGWVYGTDTRAVAYTGSVISSQTVAAGSLTLSNLTSGSGEYLFVRGVAIETPNTVTFTPTTAFSTMSAAGTTGGANITNMSVRSEFRILTTSSLASAPTIGTATSNASIYYAFYETVVSRGRTYFILLD